MTAMTNSPGVFVDESDEGGESGDARRLAAAVGAGWVLLGLGAWIYARMKGIPEWMALPVTAAFLIEFPFYLFPGFRGLARMARKAGQSRARRRYWRRAAIAPWLVYSIATSEARVTHFLPLLLIVLAGVFLVCSRFPRRRG